MRALGRSLTTVVFLAALNARAQVTVSLDATADVRPIDPMIYGVNFAAGTPAQLTELKYPANRWGGNATTRYNWKLHSQNVAADWLFLSINSDRHGDEFDASIAAGSDLLVTVPMIGWVSAVDGTKACSYPVDAFPGQDAHPYASDSDSRGVACGSGKRNGEPIALTDAQKVKPCAACPQANLAVDVSFVRDWVADIRTRWPAIHRYALDNEPILWQSTHQDVRGKSDGSGIQGLAAAELWDLTVTYATAIKGVDPQAKIHGPVFWGWCAYFGGDATTADLQGCDPSRWDTVGWYLKQVKNYYDQHGVLLVDYLDLHYYPQSGEYTGNESLAATRLESTRELWDPTYVSKSWIGAAPRLIPRMREWVSTHAPGLPIKLALSEYNWGDNEGISAALAQAEILGIFGRHGLDAGYRWVRPGANQPMILDAFRMYLSYDGAGARVVGESIKSASSAVDTVGGYGVKNGDRLLVALVNKSASTQAVTVNLANASLTGAAGDLYGFTQAQRYARVSGLTPSSATSFSVSMPARSARLAALPLQPGANPCNANGSCEANENWVNCPADCPKPACNNDGKCDVWESTATCAADCPVCNHDGSCGAGETTANCPDDCPANPCDDDGSCEVGETPANCAGDCAAQGDWSSTADATPASVAVGASTTVTAHVKNNGATADGIVQVMLRGPGASDLVLKNCGDPTPVSLAGAGKVTDCSASWTATEAGTYTIAVGVFAAGWSPMHDWNNSAGTFTVTPKGVDAGQPPGRDAAVGASPDAGQTVPLDAAVSTAVDGSSSTGPVSQGCGCGAVRGGPLAMGWLALILLGTRRRRR